MSKECSDDSDVQVIACYREQPIFPTYTVAGRSMMTDTTQCTNDAMSPLWPDEDSINQFMQADSEFLNMGAAPGDGNYSSDYQMSQCAGLPSVRD